MQPTTSPTLRTESPAKFVGWLLAERVFRAVVSAVALAVVARHLAPAGFGSLNLALTLVGIAMPLAQLGMDVVTVRELVRQPERSGELLGTATVLRLVAGGLSAAGIYVLGHSLAGLESSRAALGPVCLMLVVQAVETPDLFFRARVQSWPTAIARTSAVTAIAVVRCVLAAKGATVTAFAWATLIELVLFQAGLWFFYLREGAIPWRFSRACARTLALEGGAFAAAAAVSGLAFRVDQLAAAWLLGDTAAGQYFAALRVIEIPTFVAVSLATALLPALSADTRAVADGRFESAAGLMAAIGWITALSTTLAGPWLMHAFFGAAYDEASTALIVRGWAMLPFCTVMVRAHLIVAARSPSIQLRLALMNLILQSLLSLALIPTFGLNGAALSFLVSELIGAWLLPLWWPSLRSTVRPQARAWLAFWQPSAWPRLLAVLRKQSTSAATQSAPSP